MAFDGGDEELKDLISADAVPVLLTVTATAERTFRPVPGVNSPDSISGGNPTVTKNTVYKLYQSKGGKVVAQLHEAGAQVQDSKLLLNAMTLQAVETMAHTALCECFEALHPALGRDAPLRIHSVQLHTTVKMAGYCMLVTQAAPDTNAAGVKAVCQQHVEGVQGAIHWFVELFAAVMKDNIAFERPRTR
jgi:hypothetical protein